MWHSPLLALSLLLSSLLATEVFAETDAGTIDKIKSAIADERRSDADRTRDKNRKPLETLKFLGLKDRFERYKRRKFWNVEIEILEPKSKFRLGHA